MISTTIQFRMIKKRVRVYLYIRLVPHDWFHHLKHLSDHLVFVNEKLERSYATSNSANLVFPRSIGKIISEGSSFLATDGSLFVKGLQFKLRWSLFHLASVTEK